jgi:hypothetical protein
VDPLPNLLIHACDQRREGVPRAAVRRGDTNAVSEPHNLFGSVIRFLQGERLDLTPSNVFLYAELARSLDIAGLAHTLEPELTRETDFDNAIPRLIHCDFEPLSIFFLQNIEKLQTNPEIWTVPYQILIRAPRSADARFASDLSRFRFAFRCAIHFPDCVKELFTREFVQAIPVDVVSVLVSDDEFSCLERTLPFLFSVVDRRCTENRELRTEINGLRQSSEEIGETIAELETELGMLETFTGTIENRLKAFEANFRGMQAALEHMPIDRFAAEFAALKGRVMSSRTNAEFVAQFQELKASAQRLTELAQRMVVMLPKRRNAWLAQMEQCDATIKAGDPLAQQMKPTEELISLIDRQLLQLTAICSEAKTYVTDCRTAG